MVKQFKGCLGVKELKNLRVFEEFKICWRFKENQLKSKKVEEYNIKSSRVLGELKDLRVVKKVKSSKELKRLIGAKS